MKILHTVESYLPSRHGMQEVVTQLSEGMVKMGHEVTVATSYNIHRKFKIINGVYIKEFDISGNYAKGITGETEEFVKFLKESDFDIICNFAAQQWATDLMLPILGDLRSKKVFVPTGFSAFYDPNYQNYFKEMETWIKGYDATVFLSESYRDINFAKSNEAKTITLIPNGASRIEFDKVYNYNEIKKKLDISKKTFCILTIGTHSGLKGHNESIEIFKRAHLKNSALLIIGNSQIFDIKTLVKAVLKTFISFFTSTIKGDCTLNCFLKTTAYNLSFKRLIDKNRMISKSLKREEIVALYKSCDLFLFPSNIECSPIVLFECCAAKLPFLVTDVGNSREIIKWTAGGQLLSTTINAKGYSYANVNEGALDLKKILLDEEQRKILAKNGYQNYIKKFTWDKITKQYEELYQQLLN